MSGSDPKWQDKWIDMTAKIYAIGGTAETIAKAINSMYGRYINRFGVVE